MKDLLETNAFKSDMKKAKKRGLKSAKIIKIIQLLLNDAVLPTSARPHKLKGEYSDCWECHIEPDWLLIYINNSESLQLIRTGTHSDLFKKY